jgi:putative drug exporter of the RND superfamily
MRSLASWSFRHRRVVVALWVAVLVLLSAIHGAVGSGYKDSFDLGGTESADAIRLLQRAAPAASGDTDRLVIATKGADVTSPAVRARVEPMLKRVAALPHVSSVASPYVAAGARQVAKDRRVAFATVQFDKQAIDISIPAAKKVVRTVKSAQGGGVQVELGGQVAQQANPQGVGGTGFGVLAAAIVLFLAFGSIWAMALPLLTAAVSLGTGIALTGLLSHLITTATFSEQLSLLIGLGVGIDYALFIVTRFRQGLLQGSTPEEAAIDALDTSGRAVLFAGITVCIALLGMFALGVSFLYGVAVAASVVVACTVVASLTLLPALLGFIGPKVFRKKQRRRLAAGEVQTGDESPRWTAWAERLQRHPVAFAGAAALVMLVLASPFLSLRLGSSDAGSDPSNTTTRKAYDLLAKGFGPGFNGPLQLVASLDGPQAKAGFTRVVDAAGRAPGVVAASAPNVLPGRNGHASVGVAEIFPKGSPQDASTTDLLHRLRDTIIPRAAGSSGPEVLVGGSTAIFEDFAHVLASKLPLFIGVVVLLSFLLLTAVFRSLVIPATAAAMNLLSVVAAFGVVTAVFQWGWLGSVIGADRTGPIEAFVPVMMFAILFGLSMDYEVFLVSRIYEEWHRSGDNRQAVVKGLAATGRTITAAATIMVLVFGAFILGGNRIIKLFGLGLASAVFLDALIVRSIIVPGLMLWFGKANWSLPHVLDRRLPRLNVEGAAAQAESGA